MHNTVQKIGHCHMHLRRFSIDNFFPTSVVINAMSMNYLNNKNCDQPAKINHESQHWTIAEFTKHSNNTYTILCKVGHFLLNTGFSKFITYVLCYTV